KLLPPLADPAAVSPGAKALFLDATGLVDLAAADAKASGWGPVGETGFFTRGVVRAIGDSRDAAAWPALYGRILTDTRNGYHEWWTTELKRIRALPQPPPRPEQDTTRGLIAQPEQQTRAY